MRVLLNVPKITINAAGERIEQLTRVKWFAHSFTHPLTHSHSLKPAYERKMLNKTIKISILKHYFVVNCLFHSIKISLFLENYLKLVRLD